MKYRPLICNLVDGTKEFITVPPGKEIIYVSYKRDNEHYGPRAHPNRRRIVGVEYMFILIKTDNGYACIDYLCPGVEKLNNEFIAVNYATADMIMAIENSNNFVKIENSNNFVKIKPKT